MANEIKGLRDGLKTRLDTISGLKVVRHLPEGSGEYPIAVIALAARRTPIVLGGSSFGADFLVHILISNAETDDAFDMLDTYIDPLGSTSIEAAIDGDTTLNAKADFAALTLVDNIGWRAFGGGWYVGADFHIGVTKTVAT